MEALRLLIAEGNEDIRQALAQELHTFHYVRCCGTGPEALAMIRQERPELLVLSMELPELDGLTVLETIVSEGIHPKVLVTTCYQSEYVELSAQRLGICYILLKPFPLEVAVRRILGLKQHLRELPAEPTAQELLAQLLQPLHMHSQLHGYYILEKVLLLMARDPVAPLCKTAYLDVARHLGTSTFAVESSIRRLIDSCYDPESWQIYFPDTSRQPKPKCFLTEMARRLSEAME